MSATYRELRRAVDHLNQCEDAVFDAQGHLLDANLRLGRAMRACRMHRGLSLRECAKYIEVSAPYLSDVELGRRSISDENLDVLLGILLPAYTNGALTDLKEIISSKHGTRS